MQECMAPDEYHSFVKNNPDNTYLQHLRTSIPSVTIRTG